MAKLEKDNAELAKLVRAIMREELGVAFETNLKPIKSSLDKLQGQVTSCLDKVGDLETAANATTIELAESKTEIEQLKKQVASLKIKADSLENHSRKFNVKIIGLSNGVEDGRPTQFVSKLLYELFGETALGPPPLINIAHRIGETKTDKVTGITLNRVMICRLHSFEVRQTIIRLAAQNGKNGIQYQGRKLSFYPDTTAEQREKQAAFDDVRSALRKTTLRFGLVHPAKLLVTFQGETRSFTDASKAMTFYQDEIEPTLPAIEAEEDGDPTPS